MRLILFLLATLVALPTVGASALIPPSDACDAGVPCGPVTACVTGPTCLVNACRNVGVCEVSATVDEHCTGTACEQALSSRLFVSRSGAELVRVESIVVVDEEGAPLPTAYVSQSTNVMSGAGGVDFGVFSVSVARTDHSAITRYDVAVTRSGGNSGVPPVAVLAGALFMGQEPRGCYLRADTVDEDCRDLFRLLP